MTSTWTFIQSPYTQSLSEIYDKCQTSKVCFLDHMNGFDVNRRNRFLDYLDARAKEENKIISVWTGAYAQVDFFENYKNLIIGRFDITEERVPHRYGTMFDNYKNPPAVNFNNFLCSFNGSAHTSRLLLTSILRKNKWFDSNYCSQLFPSTAANIDGAIKQYAGDRERFYRKFFEISDVSEITNHDYLSLDHNHNIKILESKITQSFVHLVSETMATSYCPFITEKAFYSIVTKGLFVTYGQPNWHHAIEYAFGFKKYNKIFDYTFDSIDNPVERLLALTTMLSKFSNLSKLDWHDLYLMEEDTINYNYNQYYSKDFLKQNDTLHQRLKEHDLQYLKEHYYGNKTI